MSGEDQPPARKRHKPDGAAKFRRGPEVATRRVRSCGCAVYQRAGAWGGVQRQRMLASAPPPNTRPPAPWRRAACSPPTTAPARPSPHRTSPLLLALTPQQIEDKKLKGKLRYSERVVADAQAQAAKVDEWLLPAEAGALEADGPLERTWRFSQADIVQVCARLGLAVQV